MSIDWSKVVSGKTVLAWDAGHGFQDTEFHVIHVFGDSVWFTTNQFSVPITSHKSDFKNCHIKEDWQEITEECEFYIQLELVLVQHKGLLLSPSLIGEKYKLGPGLRVFKRVGS